MPLLQQRTCIWSFQWNTQNFVQKPGIDKTCANFFPLLSQQEKDSLNNQPTTVTVGFINSMVDSIVHDKIQEFMNQMVLFYKSTSE